MSYRRPLTQRVHERLSDLLQVGDRAIDATAGNGHDTLFLAEQVGATGRVLAFDIQQAALDQVTARLQATDTTPPLNERVELLCRSHEYLRDSAPHDWPNTVSTITFNLGYLPGGDKTITTSPASTLSALEQSADLLKPGGCLSILAYRGHPGGLAESEQVQAWLSNRQDLALEIEDSPGPILLWACKRSVA